MKRLIVCCDGTWNQLANACPTNVVKLAQAIPPVAPDGTAQIVFYEEGLGTKGYDRVPGGAFGWGIDQNIQSAYRFLGFNYAAGDEIYLFGFSRGAYTVRSLAGMINCAGLLSRAEICYAPDAYRLYRDREIKPGHPSAQQFRNRHGARVAITLLGCWDTVGALGIPDLTPGLAIDNWFDRAYRFHDTQLSGIIRQARHAVAIDERRKVFDVTPMQPAPSAPHALKQVWFPGGHGCVGGGTLEHRGLSDGALVWMLQEAAALGLAIDWQRVAAVVQPNPTIPFGNAPGLYRLAGLHHRTLEGGAHLHASVQARWQTCADYRPPNLSPFRAELDPALLVRH